MTTASEAYGRLLARHYERVWRQAGVARHWTQGPVLDLPDCFSVLEFKPSPARQMWTYATCGMSAHVDTCALELHLFSPEKNDRLIELLTAVAHFHCTGARLGLGHTVNFGQPWLPRSRCSYGLVSLPYLDGPDLEVVPQEPGGHPGPIHCLWLIPVTAREVRFKKKQGLEALEALFDRARVDYADPHRADVLLTG